VVYPPWSSKELIALVDALTNKEAADRLGTGDNVEAIKSHSFFSPLDWVKLGKGELPVPITPKERNPPPTHTHTHTGAHPRATGVSHCVHRSPLTANNYHHHHHH